MLPWVVKINDDSNPKIGTKDSERNVWHHPQIYGSCSKEKTLGNEFEGGNATHENFNWEAQEAYYAQIVQAIFKPPEECNGMEDGVIAKKGSPKSVVFSKVLK